jgi:hypothetical protein
MKQIKKRSALAVGAVALGLLLSASTVLAEAVKVDGKGYVTGINNLKVIDDLGKTTKYNVKFKYDTAANLYKKNGFDFNGEDDAFFALGAVQKSLNKWSPTPKKAGSMGTKQFFIGVEEEQNTFVVGIGAEYFSGPKTWDDCKAECFLATATGKSNENYTWAIFTKVNK